MRNPSVRRLLALVAGLVLANALIFVIENASSRVYRLPPELQADATTMADPVAREAFMQAWKAYMPTAPLGLMLFPLAAWLVGTALGVWLAARLAPESARWNGRLIGGLILLGTAVNLSTLPHPTWMWLAGPLVVVVGAWLGDRLAGGASPAA